MKYLLIPFSWLYGFIIYCRNKAFDWKLLESVEVGVPVISVGNLTMGGTGKTPLVEYIVKLCLAKGRKVAVVSRGYKRESEGVVVVSDGKSLLASAAQAGDEPVQIAKKFPGAMVIVGERRVDAARKAIDLHGVNVVVLDDGFQHRYLKRNLDILVLDARKDLFRIPMIPAGERRESLASIKRANVLAFSRADAAPAGNSWMNWLGEKNRVPKIRYRYKLEHIQQVGANDKLSPRDLKGRKFFLFSGIGDHNGFVAQMVKEVIDVAGELGFPDHHTYTSADQRELARRAMRSDANAFLTTEKDIARLMGNMSLFQEFVPSYPLFYAGIAVDILSGKETLDSMIDQCLIGNLA